MTMLPDYEPSLMHIDRVDNNYINLLCATLICFMSPFPVLLFLKKIK